MSLGHGPERMRLRDECAKVIVDGLPNPADWLLVIRAWVVELRMRPERCIPLGWLTLDMVLFHVLEEADKDNRQTADVVLAALKATVERAMGRG